jgi:acid phosphatase class B
MKKKIKVLVTVVCIYFAIFTSVNLADLRVGFDYDDTLMFSTPAFRAASATSERPFSPAFWKVVNQSFQVEKVKLVPMSGAVLAKVLGFDVVIITARPDYGGSQLRDHWKWLAKEFYFEKDKSSILEKGRFIVFFGDSDSDITEAREAKVRAIRVKRSPESDYKDKYNPGCYDEFILPFSE